jgi:hypothetical protein
MKKLGIALVLAVGVAGLLTGCTGDVNHNNVKITGKDIVPARYLEYLLYFDVNGKEYVYPTTVREYNQATVGESVDVEYIRTKGVAYIEPVK